MLFHFLFMMSFPGVFLIMINENAIRDCSSWKLGSYLRLLYLPMFLIYAPLSAVILNDMVTTTTNIESAIVKADVERCALLCLQSERKLTLQIDIQRHLVSVPLSSSVVEGDRISGVLESNALGIASKFRVREILNE